MWATGILTGIALLATVSYHFVGRDHVSAIEHRRRALAALREIAEHPRPPVRELVPPPDYSTDHVRVLEHVPSELLSRARTPARRAYRQGAVATRPDDRLLTDRRTVAICPAAPAPSATSSNAAAASPL